MVTSLEIRSSLFGLLKQCVRLGFRPSVVIDVGAASGTIGLVELFPEAFHVLIEPLQEFLPELERVSHTLACSVVITSAAGSTSGETVLNVHDDLYGSSLYPESDGACYDGEARVVTVLTLDELISSVAPEGPYLVKIDVQGAEFTVIEGARNVLANTEYLVLECSLFNFYRHNRSVSDITALMASLDFSLYDIGGFHYRPLDGALGQVDLAFVKTNGFFRKSHNYATPEQRAVLALKAPRHTK